MVSAFLNSNVIVDLLRGYMSEEWIVQSDVALTRAVWLEVFRESKYSKDSTNHSM